MPFCSGRKQVLAAAISTQPPFYSGEKNSAISIPTAIWTFFSESRSPQNCCAANNQSGQLFSGPDAAFAFPFSGKTFLGTATVVFQLTGVGLLVVKPPAESCLAHFVRWRHILAGGYAAIALFFTGKQACRTYQEEYQNGFHKARIR